MAELTLSNNNTISYHDSGTGTPILFLHSFGHNKNLWYPQLTYFRDLGYRVIAPDMPGHGDSSFDPDNHTVDLIAKSYVEFLEALKIENVILAGISIGGYIALRMWARQSRLISALVMCCSKAEADSDEIKERRRAQIENIHKNGLENFIITGAPKRVSPITAEQKPWVVDWIKMMNFTVSAEANAETLEAMAIKEDDTATLATIDVPALILSGSHDIFIPKESPHNLNKGIKNSTHHVIQDAGHVASLENPTAVNRYMEDFLKAL
ncbi:MAG: alpha/beta hydrolase [Woeseiaceae bacterium]|nr:alpha/beta hydrolase [Woeseiaceae bacterium]